MSRIWTLKDLNDVHPLPEGWTWADDPSVGWHARYPVGYTVCIDASDDIVALFDGTEHFEPPRRVCLAVILASMGLDSAGRRHDVAWVEIHGAVMHCPCGHDTDFTDSVKQRFCGRAEATCDGCGERWGTPAAADCETLVVSGTVQP